MLNRAEILEKYIEIFNRMNKSNSSIPDSEERNEIIENFLRDVGFVALADAFGQRT